MGSWERFTKKAIDDFKQRRGNDADNDRQHVAYAIVFSSIREQNPIESKGDLKQRIEVFAAKHPPSGVDRPRTEASRDQQERPRQQDLIDRAPDREKPTVDRQIDATIQTLRGLAPQLRSSIEASARDMILEGHHTQKSARETLPNAVRELQAERSDKNTVHTLTLAVIAKTPEHRALLNELWDKPLDQMKAIENEGRVRLEKFPPLETGLADVRKAAVEAAVRAGVAPSPQAQREALVLAHAREELECKADPSRLLWQNVGNELAADLR